MVDSRKLLINLLDLSQHSFIYLVPFALPRTIGKLHAEYHEPVGKFLLSFKIFNRMSPPDDFVPPNIEVTSSAVSCSSFAGAIFRGQFF